jgi:hypothetical protein
MTCYVCIGSGATQACIESSGDCSDWADFSTQAGFSCTACAMAGGEPVGLETGAGAVPGNPTAVVLYTPTDVRIRRRSGEESRVASDATQAVFDREPSQFMAAYSGGRAGIPGAGGAVSPERAEHVSELFGVPLVDARAGTTSTSVSRRTLAFVVGGVAIAVLVGTAFATGLVGGSSTKPKVTSPASTLVSVPVATAPPFTTPNPTSPVRTTLRTPTSVAPPTTGMSPSTTAPVVTTTVPAPTTSLRP